MNNVELLAKNILGMNKNKKKKTKERYYRKQEEETAKQAIKRYEKGNST